MLKKRSKNIYLKKVDSKVAFTLAEVLITLGIIGIVAALTLPTLIQNYQKGVLKSQFKKSFTIIANAIEKSRADLGYEPICSYGFSSDGGAVKTNCSDLHNQMLANLAIIKTCPNKAFENGCIAAIKGVDTVRLENNPNLTQEELMEATNGVSWQRETNIRNNNAAYILKDGSMLMPNPGSSPIYLVDVNGLRGPNKWGYDIFTFYISHDRLQCIERGYEKGGFTCKDMLLN